MSATVLSVNELKMTGFGDGVKQGDLKKQKYFDVVLSAPDTDGAAIAGAATGIPQRGDSYAAFSSLKCLNRTVSPAPDSTGAAVYRVVADYGIDVTIDSNVEPWLRSDLYSWGKLKYDYALQSDFSDPPQPIVNSAGDPFENPLVVPVYNPTFVVKRARRAIDFNPFLAAQLLGTVNKQSLYFGNFFQTDPRLIHFFDMSADQDIWVDKNGQSTLYFNIQLHFEYAKSISVYDIPVLDCGFRSSIASPPAGTLPTEPIKDKNGTPITSPALLHNGQPSDTAYYKLFVIREEADWDILF